jgi:diguanylate cyclase (GGDEF)-like protein/PAS domain S-box-containing protein
MTDQSQESIWAGSAVRVAGQGIAILTPGAEPSGPEIAFVNDGFCSIYGASREQLIGESVAAFGIVEEQQDIVTDLLHHAFERRPFEAEATARRRDGSEFEAALQIVPVEDAGALTHWVAFVRDITDEKRQLLMLRHQATHDVLTNLPNRNFLVERLDKAIENARRTSAAVALLLMDLDRFREVNDTFGHQFGDLLLTQVAARLRNLCRSGDTVARLGGDEFAIVIPNAGDASSVGASARRLLQGLQEPFAIEKHMLEVGASIGIALYPAHGTDARTLLRRADVAMYAAKSKQAGYAIHSDEFESRSPEELSLVVEMRRAIEQNEFELYYQPKLHLRTGLVTRAEVLIRWNHPQRGLLAPAAFIGLAERTGIIRSITDWVFDHAMRQAKAWHELGAPLHLAINVSPRSLQEQTLPAKVHGLLSKWQMDPRVLKLEITESSIMADPAHALAILSLLQGLGVQLSIDDFGTGYSSLSHLRQLPVDEIKIDRSFVLGMTSSAADASIVRTVVDLAHNLGKQVCAEGIENAETWTLLKELGCDLAQGYWISRPVPAAAMYQWLVDTAWGLAKSQPTRSAQSTGR